MKSTLIVAKLLFLLPFILVKSYGQAPDKVLVAFYNIENFFDTIDSPYTQDSEFTPTSAKEWNSVKYYNKLDKIASVIAAINGHRDSETGPDIIGFCEVENSSVLKDIINYKTLKTEGYKYIHTDSPDERGIDVALMYKPKSFTPEHWISYTLHLMNPVSGKNDHTRDQLVVGGLLNNRNTCFIINHWPSRSGGQIKSEPNRIAAALLTKHIADSVLKSDSTTQLIIMGDFNDDPDDISLARYLNVKPDTDNLKDWEFYNPLYSEFSSGYGSLCYRDVWNLFDQIIVNDELLKNYSIEKSQIFAPDYLKEQEGRYKNYPFRTFAGSKYLGGYSDHLPVYIQLKKNNN
ncbi:MAG: endonuclease/exonuclease/phosphatase family protein [Bacteroidales bacterium]|nr:endonuclease/exonuclease/phosphatase family protein [Bacteroidales bacterium]MBN2820973.1 endonuclease/exonuclease/phosphatase family protein [Bacteroidales bacterium]